MDIFVDELGAGGRQIVPWMEAGALTLAEDRKSMITCGSFR